MKLYGEIPEFPSAKWVNGMRTKDQLLGRPTLVHFWTAGCAMSEAALARVNEWRRTYAGDEASTPRLQVVGVHLPRDPSDAAAAKAYIASRGLTHPVLLDDERAAASAFGCACAPAYYVFDRDGRLRHYQAGEQGLGLLERRIHKLVIPKETV